MRSSVKRAALAGLAGCLASLAGPAAAGPPASLEVGQSLARFAKLQPGVHRYLRYTAQGDVRAAIDIWSRRISFETRDGKPEMHIQQRWDEATKPVVVIQDSWFDRDTFRPLTHVKTADRDGKIEVGGYRFLAGEVVGLKDLPDNAKRDFRQASPEAAYNFEYDMEVLQALPLAAGYTVSIPFYDPGLDPPARYVFKVAGSARIAGPEGRPMDCWLVTADYNTGKVVSRFWFDKRTQLMIREEQPHDDGSVLVKTLLPPEAGDA